MSWLHEKVATQWRHEGKKYVVGVNDYVRIGIESNWQQEQEPPKEDTRSKLAIEVVDMIRGANSHDDIERLRQEIPAATWPITSEFEQELQAIRPLAFMKNGSVFVYTDSGVLYLVNQDQIKELPELNYVGSSPNGKYLALVNQQGIRIVCEWGSDLEEEITFLSWTEIQKNIKEAIPHLQSLADEEHPESSLDEVIPFGDGKQLLLVCRYGIYLLKSEKIELLHPDISDFEEDEEEEIYLDMAHGAVSPDERWLAFGSQDSEHILKDLLEGAEYTFQPESSYPHYALFSHDSREVWYNACHFYNGVTIRVPVIAIEDSVEEWPIMEDEMRVYAAVALQDGHILGDAYGYLRFIDREGQEKWRYFVGSTISGMAVTANGERLAVGTYAGMLHFIDLNCGSRSEYSIGTANIIESSRWILWRNEKPLRW